MRTSTVQRLFDAVASGGLWGVRELLDSGVPVNARNSRGETPLIVAARTGRAAVAQLLISRGARVASRTDPLLGLNEPVTVSEVRSTFERARCSVELQEHLQSVVCATGAELIESDDLKAFEVLDSTDDLLAEAGPLLAAAVCGHRAVVEVLLAAGADPNALDWTETPPIVGAASMGNADIVSLLVEAGARIDAGLGFTALEEAVVKGHYTVVQRLLIAGADVNRRNEDGGTPLMVAAATGRLPIVQLLVEAGADVDVVTDGEAALTCAASYGHLGVYAYLLPRSKPTVQAKGDQALGAYLEYVAHL